MLKQERDDRWERAGVAPVDAGLILIADPCYLSQLLRDSPEEQARRDAVNPLRDWDQFLDTQVRPDSSHDVFDNRGYLQVLDNDGYKLGTLIGGFGGDGEYPVLVLKDKFGAVRAALIVFDEDEDDDEVDLDL